MVLVSKRVSLPPSAIRGVRCGWRGCQAGYLGDKYPAGWSVLMVHDTPSKKAVAVEARVAGRRRIVLDLDGLDWRHDKVLCAEHGRALDVLLSPGTGAANPLHDTAGEA